MNRVRWCEAQPRNCEAQSQNGEAQARNGEAQAFSFESLVDLRLGKGGRQRSFLVRADDREARNLECWAFMRRRAQKG